VLLGTEVLIIDVVRKPSTNAKSMELASHDALLVFMKTARSIPCVAVLEVISVELRTRVAS
jgi:hypothetical protein